MTPPIRLPESVEECRALRLWAETADDSPVPAEPAQLARHLEFLAATLPAKHIDEDTAKMRFAVYARILAGQSNEALAYMARRACETLDWFPTPRQCLDLAAQYPRPETDKNRALALCHRFTQGRFEGFIADLKAGQLKQAQIDEAPEQWRKIAGERGLLRWDGERFVVRVTA